MNLKRQAVGTLEDLQILETHYHHGSNRYLIPDI